jgi:hypothetical protein
MRYFCNKNEKDIKIVSGDTNYGGGDINYAKHTLILVALMA